VDVAGVVLGGLTLAAVTYAFVQAGHAGVGSPVVVAAVVAAIAGAAFVAVERTGQQPMLPLPLFRRPVFTTANGVAGTMNLVTLGLLFVLTLYLQNVRHHSALVAGLALFPLFLPLCVLPPVVGRVAALVGTKWPMAIGLLVAAVGLGLLARVGATSGYATLLPVLLLWGVGLGLLAPAVVAAAISAVPAERAGLASGMNNTARQAGGAIGIAAFGALAGSPGAHTFLSGMHAGGLIGAGLFAAAAAVAVSVIPGDAARPADER
jgi:MFS transporter, DHA2 family, methylenomycin A resistance protein